MKCMSFESRVTSHLQVIVTLVYVNNPTPKGATSTQWTYPLWVSTGYFPSIRLCTTNDYLTYTLYTTQGNCMYSSHRGRTGTCLYSSCQNCTKSIFQPKLPHVPASNTVYCHTCEASITLYDCAIATNKHYNSSQGCYVSGAEHLHTATMHNLTATSHDVIGIISEVMCSTALKDDWWSPAK